MCSCSVTDSGGVERYNINMSAVMMNCILPHSGNQMRCDEVNWQPLSRATDIVNASVLVN